MYDYQGNLLHKNMESDNQRVSKIEYALSIDMAKELSMVERNEKGKQARRYFIACEKGLIQIASTNQKPKQQEQKPASLNDKMKTATWAAKFLNMNDNSKLILAKPILEQVGLPVPDYTPSKGVLSSAKELLSKRNIIHNGKKLTTKVLNEILEKNGIIRTLTRKTSKGQDKPFKNITEKGSVYGENQVSQYDARETQPLWFVEKFDELLKAVGLQSQSELF